MIKKYVKNKTNNTIFKSLDIQYLLYKALIRVKKEDWIYFIGRVKEEELKFWNLDFIFDELVDNLSSHKNDDVDDDFN